MTAGPPLRSLVRAAAALVVVVGIVGLGRHAWTLRARADYAASLKDYEATGATRLMELPRALRESSGVAVSRINPGLFWTHNDSGDGPVVYGVRHATGIAVELRFDGASATDWEDMDLGPCPWDGDSSCIYVADIGDNFGRRRSVTIYVTPEPLLGEDPPARMAVEWKSAAVSYPGGARDAEALAVLPDGDVLVVSKGSEGSHQVFLATAGRLLDGFRGGTLPLARLGALPLDPDPLIGKVVTAAAATGDGTLVVRTYGEVFFFSQGEGGWALIGTPCFVGRLGAGGEGLDIDESGAIYLTREAAFGRPGTLDEVRCDP